MNLYLNQALLTGNKFYQHFTGFILYQHNKAYFDQELFPIESDETYKAIIAQHLFSQMALYVPKTNRDTALESFFNRNMSAIKKYLKKIHAANNYVRFSSSVTADQLINNHHIVITDDEISDPENKRVLSALLNRNQNHKVVLEVGRKFVKDGCLNVKISDLPKGLAHLILTNTTGNATAIGDNFLHSVINLKSCDTAGLTNVISIGNDFLFDAQILKSFDAAGLTSVTSIGNDFLRFAKALQSFDTVGLTSVRLIGNQFLLGAEALQSFDTVGLTSVRTIGHNFLYDSKSLQSFDIARLVNVKSIGNYFLDKTPWFRASKKTLDDWKSKFN